MLARAMDSSLVLETVIDSHSPNPSSQVLSVSSSGFRVDSVNRINRTNRVNRINRVNRVNRVDRVNRINKINRVNRV